MYHDELAPVYAPVYFTDFIAHAHRHQLQFVGEAAFHEMSDHALSEDAQQALRQLADDRIRREQYLDFFRVRRFRQTLLTHAATPLAARPDPAVLREMQLRLARPLAAAGQDLQAGVAITFTAQPRGQLQLDLPVGKAALLHLIAEHPHAVPWKELLTGARSRLAAAGMAAGDEASSHRQLSEVMLQLQERGLVRVHSWSPQLPRRPGPRPATSPIARWQIQRGTQVTTLTHQSVQIEDQVGKLLIELLDGTRDRAALGEALATALEALEAHGVTPDPTQPAAKLRTGLAAALERNLQALADIGLLVG
jgi:hypothetical protein